MKDLFIALAFLLFCTARMQAQEATVYFETKSTGLNKASKTTLDSLFRTLAKPYSNYRVTITGYSDSKGDAGTNQKLSLQRAENTKDHLTKKGLTGDYITSTGLGELKPIASNATDEGRSRNRRVTVKVEKWSGIVLEKAGLEVKKDKQTFKAEQGSKFTYSSGSVISIPPNALMTKDGKPVSGEVTLTYREFRDAADFIVSNIPMNWESGGQQVAFNSGGMFEIRAYKGNEELFLKQGSNIDINFRLTDTLPNLKFYRLNANETWTELNPLTNILDSRSQNIMGHQPKNLGRPTCLHLEKGDDSCTIVKKAIYKGLELLAMNIASVDTPAPASIVSFAMRYDSNEYLNSTKKQGLSDEQLKMLHTIQLKMLSKKFRKNISFTITDKRKAASELDVFKKVECTYDTRSGEMDEKSFKARYSDIRIAPDSSGFRIELKSSKGIKSFHAELKNEDPAKLLKIYNDKLTARAKSFNDSLELAAKLDAEKKLQSMLSDSTIKYNSIHIWDFWVVSRLFMEEEEKGLTESEWKKFFFANKDMMKARYEKAKKENETSEACKPKPAGKNDTNKKNGNDDSSNPVTTTTRGSGSLLTDLITNTSETFNTNLSVVGFGYYNCDQIEILVNRIEIKATFNDKSGAVIKGKTMYVVDKKINGSLSFYPYRFMIDPGSEVMLILFDEKGDRYVYRPSDLKKLQLVNNGSYNLVMENVTAATSTVDGLRKILAQK
jgi:hypothetical protein